MYILYLVCRPRPLSVYRQVVCFKRDTHWSKLHKKKSSRMTNEYIFSFFRSQRLVDKGLNPFFSRFIRYCLINQLPKHAVGYSYFFTSMWPYDRLGLLSSSQMGCPVLNIYPVTIFEVNDEHAWFQCNRYVDTLSLRSVISLCSIAWKNSERRNF